ncbi:RHS repeat-associated core domain-containing protein [Pseudoalteromonas sp. OOF1S-7]|uniref:RHS repeat-associated core domain-containing protein n=1 Tax=Pseudoalteromonas sp. OOF1S-7 TaxID=2917757 RepID=UPI001EF6C269|nr:RHS repeat-associated core domain-containing protein [Pseudoalteromonas sp. OOF1S-7]MCG7537639.1 hypothetical protein [Pseudoalteromonas sp. OOF1S-7]
MRYIVQLLVLSLVLLASTYSGLAFARWVTPGCFTKDAYVLEYNSNLTLKLTGNYESHYYPPDNDDGESTEFDRISKISIGNNTLGNTRWSAELMSEQDLPNNLRHDKKYYHVPVVEVEKLPAGKYDLKVQIKTIDYEEPDDPQAPGSFDRYTTCTISMDVYHVTRPSFRSTSPSSDTSIVQDEALTVSFTAYDAGTDFASFSLYRNDIPITAKSCETSRDKKSKTCSRSYDKNTLKVGEHTFKAIVKDSRGYQTSKTRKITVLEKNSAPTISNFSVSPEFGAAGEAISVSFTVEDSDEQNQNKLSHVTLQRDNQNPVTVSQQDCALSELSSQSCTLAFGSISGDNAQTSITLTVYDLQEANASDSGTVEFVPADLTVSSVTVSPGTPFIDDIVTITANVNSGLDYLDTLQLCAIRGGGFTQDAPCPTGTIISNACDMTNGSCSATYNLGGRSSTANFKVYAANRFGDTDESSLTVVPNSYFGAALGVNTNPGTSLFVEQPVPFVAIIGAINKNSKSLKRIELRSGGTLLRSYSVNVPLYRDRTTEQRFSWTPQEVRSNMPISAVLYDDKNQSVYTSSVYLDIVYPETPKPGLPQLTIDPAGAGTFRVVASELSNTAQLNFSAHVNGSSRDVLPNAEVKSPGEKAAVEVDVSYADHNKTLSVCVLASNYRVSDGEPLPDTIKEADRQVCATERISYPKPTPDTPKFSALKSQVGGRYTVQWQQQNDGATNLFRLYRWNGLPIDRNLSNLLYEGTANQVTIEKPEQGHVTYEIQACYDGSTCTAGQQFTVEHLPPYIQSASIDECGANRCLYVKGIGFSQSQTSLQVQLRQTAETYSYSSNLSIQQDGFKVLVSDYVADKLIDGGAYLKVNNGVSKNDAPIYSSIVVDGSGSENGPDLLSRGFSFSENGILYAGSETGLNAYIVTDKQKFELKWSHKTPAGVADASKYDDVVAMPLVKSNTSMANGGIYDDIYIGARNNRFYSIRHDITNTNESSKRVKWLFDTRGPIIAPAQLTKVYGEDKPVVYVGSLDEALYALNAETGEVYWHYVFPGSGGVVAQPQVSADGHVYVQTDKDVYVINPGLIKRNAMHWQGLGELEALLNQYFPQWRDTIAKDAKLLRPEQRDEAIWTITELMFVLRDESPTKDQLNVLSYLVTNDLLSIEEVARLILGSVTEDGVAIYSNSAMSNEAFTLAMIARAKNISLQVAQTALVGGKNYLYWQGLLEQGMSRANLVLELLFYRSEQYDQLTLKTLNYFYDFCTTNEACSYSADDDGDGLSFEAELLLGTDPFDKEDGLQTAEINVLSQNFGNLTLGLSVSGPVEFYDLEMSVNGQPYESEPKVTASSSSKKAPNSDSTTYNMALHNGNYKFRARACISVAVNTNTKTFCSPQYAETKQVYIQDSVVQSGINVHLSEGAAKEPTHDQEALLQHARLTPTQGNFRVTENGSASYTVPIELPSGIAGVTPEVTLNYDSQAGSSNVALGWSIGAGGAISRCAQTFAQDGQFKPLTFTQSDRFCLGGQRLIPADVTGDFDDYSPLETYVLELDSQVTVAKISTADSVEFLVKAKDGTLKRYGGAADNEIRLGNRSDRVLTWLLHSVYDNMQLEETAIKYEYSDAVSGQVLGEAEKVLTKITYSGNSVVFNYRAGEIRRAGYVFNGLMSSERAELQSITVENHFDRVLSRYVLDTETAANGLRLLISVKQCDTGSVCKLPIQFNYDAFSDSLSYTSSAKVYSLPYHREGKHALAAVTSVDSEGDGIPEIAVLERYEGKDYKLCLLKGGDRLADASRFACADFVRGDDEASVSVESIDHNNDGKQELFVNMKKDYDSNYGHDYFAIYELVGQTLQRVDITDLFVPSDSASLERERALYFKEPKFADLNGDGYSDIVYKLDSSEAAYVRHYDPVKKQFATPLGLKLFSTDYWLGAVSEEDGEWFLTDMNADGLADIVSLKCTGGSKCDDKQSNSVYVFYNHGVESTGTNQVQRFRAKSIVSSKKVRSLQLNDANADGLVDLLFLDVSEWDDYKGDQAGSWQLWINQSQSEPMFERNFTYDVDLDLSDRSEIHKDITTPTAIDVDRNGKPDLFFRGKRDTKWTHYEWSPQNNTLELADKFVLSTATLQSKAGDYLTTFDFDYDGNNDLLFKNGGSIEIRYDNSMLPTSGLLRTVTQGYDSVTAIDYASMTEPSVYEGNVILFTQDEDVKRADLKVSKYIAPMQLVSQVTTDSPNSNNVGTVSVDYFYEGARVQFGGRGMLGFQSLTTTTYKQEQESDERYAIVTKTHYLQHFPFTGMPLSTDKYFKKADEADTVISTTQYLSRAYNTYKKVEIEHRGGKAYQALLQNARECDARLNSNYTISGYGCSETAMTYDEGNNANLTESVVTKFNVSTSGSGTFVRSGSGGTALSRVTTSNEYAGSAQAKRFGRITKATATHADGSGENGISKTSAFVYYGASDTHPYMLKQEIIAPGGRCDAQLTKTYIYDDVGNIKRTETSNDSDQCARGEKQTRVTEHVYDADGRYLRYSLQNVEAAPADLSEGLENTGVLVAKSAEVLVRNAHGAPTKILSPGGVFTHKLYDTFGSAIGQYQTTGAHSYTYLSECTELKCAVKSERYVNGELLETQYLDRAGRPYKSIALSVKGSALETKNFYDEYGRLLQTQAHGAKPVKTYHDIFDRVKKVVDENSGMTTETTFSGLASTTTISGRIGDESNASQSTTTTKNTLGQVVRVTDEMGNTLTYTYDVMGNQDTVSSSADNGHVLVDNEYDALGRRIELKDADRGTWTYTYNAFGELTSQTDARKVTQYFTYDLLGRKTHQSQELGAESDGKDSAAYLQTERVSEGDSTWKYGTEASNVHQLISATQGQDWRQFYFYDKFGRAVATLTSLEHASACDKDDVELDTTYYDLRIKVSDPNNLPAIADPLSSLCVIQQQAYDAHGRLAFQFDDYRRMNSGGENEYIEAQGVKNTYQYGQLFERREAREGSRGRIYYQVISLNERGQVSQYIKGGKTMAITYDPDTGNLTKIAGEGELEAVQSDSYAFDGLGNLINRTLTGFQLERFGYDDLNRVTHINGTQQFEYDSNGNLTKIGKWHQQYGQHGAAPHALTSRSNFVSDDGNGVPVILPPPPPTFDTWGSEEAKSPLMQNRFSASLSRASVSDDVHVTESYFYDANGNQTRMERGSTTIRTLKYSTRNKVKEIAGRSETVTFDYDINNRRYKRVDGNQTVYYVGALELTTKSGNDKQAYIKRYVGNDATIKYTSGDEQAQGSTIQWLFTDHQGSIVAITDQYFNVVKRMSYDVFGQLRTSESEMEKAAKAVGLHPDLAFLFDISDNTRSYTGHEPVMLDGESRIIHMNGRIYDALTGRFMQPDPITQAPGNLQNYNTFSYVYNNPLSYTDPSGYIIKPLKKLNRNIIRATAKVFGKDLTHIAGTVASAFCGPGAPACAAAWNYEYNRAMGVPSEYARESAYIAYMSATVLNAIGSNFSKMGAQNVDDVVFNGAQYSNYIDFGGNLLTSGQVAGQITAHAMIGGISSVMAGGKFGHGFFSAGVTKGAGGAYLPGGSDLTVGQVAQGTVISAVIGGTASVVSGGKFSNGARFAAMQYLYNQASKVDYGKIWDDATRTLGEYVGGVKDEQVRALSNPNSVKIIVGAAGVITCPINGCTLAAYIIPTLTLSDGLIQGSTIEELSRHVIEDDSAKMLGAGAGLLIGAYGMQGAIKGIGTQMVKGGGLSNAVQIPLVIADSAVYHLEVQDNLDKLSGNK